MKDKINLSNINKPNMSKKWLSILVFAIVAAFTTGCPEVVKNRVTVTPWIFYDSYNGNLSGFTVKVDGETYNLTGTVNITYTNMNPSIEVYDNTGSLIYSSTVMTEEKIVPILDDKARAFVSDWCNTTNAKWLDSSGNKISQLAAFIEGDVNDPNFEKIKARLSVVPGYKWVATEADSHFKITMNNTDSGKSVDSTDGRISFGQIDYASKVPLWDIDQELVELRHAGDSALAKVRGTTYANPNPYVGDGTWEQNSTFSQAMYDLFENILSANARIEYDSIVD